MIPSRQGIKRMIASLARSKDRRPLLMETESLPILVGELFGLTGTPVQIAGMMLTSWDDQCLDALASDIKDRWDGKHLIFKTSGSTGVPKKCVQDVSWLIQEGLFLARLFQNGRRVVGLVPAHHIYGFLFTVLLPEVLDVPVVDLDPLSLGSFPELLQPDDIVIGFPLIWKKAGEIGMRYPPGVTGVTSTGPCSPEVITHALDDGLGCMAEIHGSTETGGLGYRWSFRDPYCLMDHWISGGKSGGLWRVHPLGNAPERFEFPDRLDWEGERLYRPVGRKDKAVQVGGVNVYPERVRQVLLEHPLVADAAVRLMRQEEGDRLKAYIVVADTTSAPAEVVHILRDYLISTLSAPEVPRNFTFGSIVPRNVLGKDADWNLSDQGYSSMKTP